MFDMKGMRRWRTADSTMVVGRANSMRSAYVITLALSFLLWWVPGLGQATAGYVGGRKAGSPARGFAAGALAMASIFLMSLVFTSFFGNLPEGAVTGFVTDYFTSLVTSAEGVSTIALNPYALLLLFSMVGGMMAAQARKEADMLVKATAEVVRRRHRSVELHSQGKRLGFESYESCQNFSVNTMNPVNQASQAETAADAAKAAEDAPAPGPAPARKPSPVTSTLDMSSTPSTATSADGNGPFAEILRKSDSRAEIPEGRGPQDDFEYI